MDNDYNSVISQPAQPPQSLQSNAQTQNFSIPGLLWVIGFIFLAFIGHNLIFSLILSNTHPNRPRKTTSNGRNLNHLPERLAQLDQLEKLTLKKEKAMRSLIETRHQMLELTWAEIRQMCVLDGGLGVLAYWRKIQDVAVRIKIFQLLQRNKHPISSSPVALSCYYGDVMDYELNERDPYCHCLIDEMQRDTGLRQFVLQNLSRIQDNNQRQTIAQAFSAHN